VPLPPVRSVSLWWRRGDDWAVAAALR